MAVRRRGWALVVTILALALSASPASAAFPGANGRLVLTPASGKGVLIASPRTGRARRVCEPPQACGTQPTHAAFSPNGREIVFSTRGGRLEVTTVTGGCVWCSSSLPQVTIRGSNPVFTAAGKTITYIHGGIWEVAPGRPTPTRLRVVYGPVMAGRGPVSAVAWGPFNKVVAVRRGWLWTGDRNGNAVILFDRVTRGSSPVWSPDGHELAFTRKGFVFTIRTPGHTTTQIARGSAPAFSPDGRALAYLNPSHHVTIRSLAEPGREPEPEPEPSPGLEPSPDYAAARWTGSP